MALIRISNYKVVHMQVNTVKAASLSNPGKTCKQFTKNVNDLLTHILGFVSTFLVSSI